MRYWREHPEEAAELAATGDPALYDWTGTNDVHSKSFQSKLDPLFTANHKPERERKRLLDWSEVKAGFAKSRR